MCFYNKQRQRQLFQVLLLSQENGCDLQSRENMWILSKTLVSITVSLFVRCSVCNKSEVTFIDISKENEHSRQLLHHLAPQYAAELQPSAFFNCNMSVIGHKQLMV